MASYGGGGRAGIRHAYPLAVTSASFMTAFVLNLRTLPYAFVRFFLHAVHAIVALAFFAAAIVCAIALGKSVHPYAGVAVFVDRLGVVVSLRTLRGKMRPYRVPHRFGNARKSR